MLPCSLPCRPSLLVARQQQKLPLQRDILNTLELLRPHAARLGNEEALVALRTTAEASRSDATWLRETHHKLGSLNDVARCQSEEWMGRATAA